MDTNQVVEQFILEDLLSGSRNTPIQPTESLVNSGVIDSLAILRLIAFLEERFGIVVEDDEVIPENFDTMVQIVDMVESKKK
jgi:acyl carrier protein